MDEFRIIITPRAGRDLDAIYNYIAQDSPQYAGGVINRILDALEPLKQTPHRAVVEHQHSRLSNAVRSVAVGMYIVYFRVLDEERVVRVLRVRHGARRRLRRFPQ